MHVGLSTCMIQRGKSGVGQYVFALVQALLARSDRPKVTLFVLEEDLPLFAFAKEQVQLQSVSESFRSPVRNILWHQQSLPRLARQLGLDVIHVPSYRRLLWPKPCALVATIHDLAPFHVQAKYDPARMFYGRVVVRRLAQRQDRIIAVSQATAADIARFFSLNGSRVKVIHNGLDHQRFCPGDAGAARASAAVKWGLDRPFFLYVSRLEHPAKNHVRLIEAFVAFKQKTGSDWLLACAGGDWHGADVIRGAAQASPLGRDIRLLGFVPDADLTNLYRAAGTVVYPSLFEGFGFPPVEAMACGCPVLSSTRGALGEVVADAAGILDPEDPGQMSAMLTRVAQDHRWRGELIAAGLRNAQRFDWAENADKVLQTYKAAAQLSSLSKG